jgi:hypothetical protein
VRESWDVTGVRRSCPSRAFEDLPAIFEGPGIEGKAPAKADVDLMRELREEGLAARR